MSSIHAVQMPELCPAAVDSFLTGAKRVILVSLSATTNIAVWLRFVFGNLSNAVHCCMIPTVVRDAIG